MQPLVTIAIPTYQRLHYLKESVASALEQTYANIEVLIGLDASKEGLNKEIQNWIIHIGKQHSRVSYFFNEKNLGLAGNWNALASKAKGQYLMIIGDDDRLLPQAVEKLISSIADSNVAFANHYLIDHSGLRLEKESRQHTIHYQRDQLKSGTLEGAEQIVWKNSVPMSASLIKTEDVRRLKFKEDLNTPEIEFFLRLSQEGGTFCFIPEYIMEFRVHPGSATSSGLKIHYLVKYLLPMKVDTNIEPFKKTFLQSLIGPAVTRLLKEGDIPQAKELFNSPYYTIGRKLRPIGIAQGLCIYFPGIMIPLLKFIARKK